MSRHNLSIRNDSWRNKRAFSIAERDKRDLEERFERERQALNDEIRQLKERAMYGYEEMFKQGRQALDDGIIQLKVKFFPPIRSEVVGPLGSSGTDGFQRRIQ